MSHRFVVVLTAVLAISMAGCAGSAASPTLTKPAPTGGARTAGAAPSAAATAGTTAPAVGSPADASGSACGLVTVDEVILASGMPMAVSGDAGIICTFSSVADPSFVVYLQIYNDKPSMALMMQLEASGSEHLAGMGDDAFWNATAGTVFVRKGSRAFSVALPSLANLTGTPAAAKANMVTLATAALARF